MKNIILTIAGIAFIAVIFGTSCEKYKKEMHPVSEKLRFESFEKYGKIHNDFLTNFKNEFKVNPNISNLDEGVGFICEFNKSFVDQADLTISEQELLKKSLEDNKRHVITRDFYNELYYSPLKNSGESNNGLLFESNSLALSKSLIDEFEYEKLNIIGLKVKENHDGNISDEELELLLLQIKDEWLLQGYNENSKHGQTLAITLAISLASIEWWKENPDAFGNRLDSAKALPVWAAADIVGAGYGAVIAGIGSYATSGEVNWGAVGLAAGGGAIAGSTGIIGKAGKWLSGLL